MSISLISLRRGLPILQRFEVSLMRRVGTLPKGSANRRTMSLRKAFFGSSLAMIAFASMNSADCAAGAGVADFIKGGNPTGAAGSEDDPVKALIAQAAPIVQQLGFGGIMGYFAGVALKRVSQEVAVLIGLAFIGFQGLSYVGYVKVDYNKIQNDVVKKLDVDGDGKLTVNDAYVVWDKVKDILQDQLPGAGGFSAGFALGIYYGK